ncbi:MAG: acyltransferase [Candidatus Diapherotrites archaeon]
MNAIKEIGFKNALKYLVFSFFYLIFKFLFISPLRVFFLSLFGAKIGKNVVIEDIKFFNLYRTGWSGLKIGNNCYLGSESVFDLAESITIEDNVTVSAGVILLTHTNVGYKNHPLQKILPKTSSPLIIDSGCFIGAGSVIVGVKKLGVNTAVAAGAVVTKNNKGNELIAGSPAKILRSFKL